MRRDGRLRLQGHAARSEGDRARAEGTRARTARELELGPAGPTALSAARSRLLPVRQNLRQHVQKQVRRTPHSRQQRWSRMYQFLHIHAHIYKISENRARLRGTFYGSVRLKTKFFYYSVSII